MNTKSNFFEGSYLAQMIGPLFLIPVLMLAGKYNAILNYDLLLIVGIGLVLCATRQTRGCAYALGLLALSATVKHLWIDSHHLFQLCLECSIAFSLLITSLIFTQATSSSDNLSLQIERKEETIQILEEELSGQREKSATDTATLQSKLTEQEMVLEETQNDLSAIRILNDVLRKSTAKAIEEKATIASQLLSADSRSGLLLEEIDSLQKELTRVSNTSTLAEQNKELFKELNAARYKETQSHLINETLARMLASQGEKTAELEQLSLANQELKEQLAEAGSHRIAFAKMEIAFAEKEKQLEELTRQFAGLEKEAFDKVQAALEEKTASLDKLRLANRDLEDQLNAVKSAPIPEVLSQRLAQSAETEALYRQLREQFAAKDLVLQQTRSQLFYADTERQRLEKELQEKELQEELVPRSVREELEVLEEEKELLSEENGHLTQLITQLIASTPTPEKKKPGLNEPSL
jgi:hypothetical protein